MTEINRYQSPLADSGKPVPGVSIWRKGSRLMVHRDARLPDICLKTGKPADRRISKRVVWMEWDEGGEYEIELPINNQWWRRHVILFRLSAGTLLASLVIQAGIGMAYRLEPPLDAYVGYASMIWLPLLFVSVVSAFATGWLPVVRKSTRTHAYLSGVHRDVLDRFPEWPG